MPVFGADTSSTKVDWEESKTSFVPRNNVVYDDVKYFVYHSKAPMDHPFTDKEWGVLMRTVARLRKRGYDTRAVRGAMNAFYIQRNDDSVHPAYAFANNELLRRLMAVYEPRFTKPVRAFIANGFQRADEELPWHPDDDADIRRSVMLYGGDLPYRYSDVVAELLVMYGDNASELNSQLRYVNDIVRWNLNYDEKLDIKEHIKAVKVSLPRELATARRAPLSIAAPAPTLRDAVLIANERGDHELHHPHRLEK
jgi:hypothetical protein